MSNLASELVTALLKCSRSLSRGWRRGSISTLSQTLLMNAVNKSWTPSCLCATKPPFLHERAWPTVNLSPHTPRLGISTRGKLYRRHSESLNSCLLRAKLWSARGIAFNQEFAPFSLDWLTNRSRSEERVDATLSIFSLSRAVLSDWWYLLKLLRRAFAWRYKCILRCDRIYVRRSYWLWGRKLLWHLSSQILHAQTPLSRF